MKNNHPNKTRQHIKSHIPNQSKFECNDCGKVFSFKKTLVRHQRLKTNERPFECKVCGKSFKLNVILKKHMYSHTGLRPYPCEHCGFGAYEIAVLRGHMKRVHPEVITNI